MIRNEAEVKREELILLPIITEGYCKGKPKEPTEDHIMIQELANGYCVRCWDHGRGGALTYNQRSSRNQQMKRKKEREEQNNG